MLVSESLRFIMYLEIFILFDETVKLNFCLITCLNICKEANQTYPGIVFQFFYLKWKSIRSATKFIS
jgi:hypothetical protein